MLTIVAALALSTTSPPATAPTAEPPLVCKRMDKTRPPTFNPKVCATAAEWKAYRSLVQKKERETIARTQAMMGASSGY